MQEEYWDSFFQAERDWHLSTQERRRWNGHEDITRVSFAIFSRDRLEELCAKNLLNMQNEIENMKENYILNVNEEQCIEYLADKYLIDIPVLDFSNSVVSYHEEDVLSDPVLVITFNLLFTGNYHFLLYRANKPVDWYYNVYILKNTRYDEFVLPDGSIDSAVRRNPQELREPYVYVQVTVKELKGGTEARKIFTNIKTMSKFFVQYLEKHNNQVRILSSKYFHSRKMRILRNYKIIESIGVPIKKRENLPESYVIPNLKARKKIDLRPPVAPEKPYLPEPVLDQSIYRDILQIINALGKVFEQLPSLYAGKGEEPLRDLLILYLTPHFNMEGSVTGETFNKTGKTDILIRYGTSIVFIAECKFWRGTKQYVETISQLLGYLTFRDTKAAVVIFVRNKEFSSVLQTIKESTPTHPNYLDFVSEEDETWLNYRFHINGDPNREVKLAVLLFHLPVIHDEKFIRDIVQMHHEVVHDPDDLLGFRACPDCGSTDLERFSDSRDDDMIYVSSCKECGWSTYTEV